MIKNRVWLCLMVALASITMVCPGVLADSVPADPNNPTDIFFQGDYSFVCANQDNDVGEWISGLSFEDIEYRDMGLLPTPDQTYDYFIKMATIPWIRITWLDANQDEHSQIYPFVDSDGPANEHIKYYYNTYDEGNSAPGGGGTDIHAFYGLDLNNDNVGDFQFEEFFSLDNVGFWQGIGGGYITLRIIITQIPSLGWVVGNQNNVIQSMDFAFMVDANIDGDADNGVFCYDVQSSTWIQQSYESGPNVIPVVGGIPVHCVRINGDSHQIYMLSQQTWGDYYCLKKADEYSQYPSSYSNNEDISDSDTVIWYVIGYDIANNQFPPIQGQQGWCSFMIDGLTA